MPRKAGAHFDKFPGNYFTNGAAPTAGATFTSTTFSTAFLALTLSSVTSSLCTLASVGAITSDTMDISLIRIFIDGPEVSLNGSPTVSPVTEALCGSDFLKYISPLI